MRRAFAAAIMAPLIASCTSAPELSNSLKPAVVCIYNALKGNNAITGVDVYVPERSSPVIAYGYRSEGAEKTSEIAVVGPLADKSYGYRGDFYQSENPLSGMADLLKTNCNVEGGFVDQVMITGPDDNPNKWHVDMSRYSK